jgi:hypothetical protein
MISLGLDGFSIPVRSIGVLFLYCNAIRVALLSAMYDRKDFILDIYS